MPRPTALPATEVPAPREVSGTPLARATASAAATSSTCRGRTTASGGIRYSEASEAYMPRVPASARTSSPARSSAATTSVIGNMLLMPSLSLPPEAPSLAEAVAQAVRDGIAAGELVPEETYSVYQLASLLGVSRSPVREGMLRPAEAGLVAVRRSRGLQVLPPRAQAIAEIIEIRLALEPAAARKAALRGT